jgi:ABC-2 type transport system ATP-binding protein
MGVRKMLLEINNLVKRYNNDFLAVDNVNLSIKEGEIFGLLGPNGAGKSTTINAVCGLTKIDSGEIKVFEKSYKENESYIKKNMGLVPQDIALFDTLTAYENATFFGKLYGLKGTELKKGVEAALNFTGLWDKRNEIPLKFSGGMKRRLNIACAIVHRPKLIIMDEPTVGIDPQSRNHILESVKELNKQGSTIIYTSHYMEEIEEICSNIVIMDQGKVIVKGSKEELKEMIAQDEKVSIDLASVNFTILDNIKKISGVKECTFQEKELKIISNKNSKNLSSIISVINDTNSEILSVNVEKPTLEGVFLTLTGRKLRD